MRHLTIESLIGLAEGTLSPRDKQDVEDHMLNCPQCFAEASEFLVVELQTCLESRTKFQNDLPASLLVFAVGRTEYSSRSNLGSKGGKQHISL